MKAIAFRDVRTLEVIDVPIPRPKSDEILVKVEYAGICGSDIHTYVKGSYVEPGQIMGHEFSGTVHEVGRDVNDINIGDKVVIRPISECRKCRHCLQGRAHLCDQGFNGNGLAFGGLPGGFAEYVVIPKAQINNNVFILPPEVSLLEAALIEPLSVALHAVNMADIQLDDKVVVFGAGPIGLCVSQILKCIGSCHVIQADLSELRLEKAKAFGVDTVINPKKR